MWERICIGIVVFSAGAVDVALAAQVSLLYEADANAYIAERAGASSPLPLFTHGRLDAAELIVEAGSWVEFYETQPRYRVAFSGQDAGVALVPWLNLDLGTGSRFSFGLGGGYQPVDDAMFGHARASVQVLQGDIDNDNLLLSFVARGMVADDYNVTSAMVQALWSRELARQLIFDRTARWIHLLLIYVEAGYGFASGPELISTNDLSYSGIVAPRIGISWMHMFGESGARVHFDGAPSVSTAFVSDDGSSTSVDNFRLGLAGRTSLRPMQKSDDTDADD